MFGNKQRKRKYTAHMDIMIDCKTVPKWYAMWEHEVTSCMWNVEKLKRYWLSKYVETSTFYHSHHVSINSEKNPEKYSVTTEKCLISWSSYQFNAQHIVPNVDIITDPDQPLLHPYRPHLHVPRFIHGVNSNFRLWNVSEPGFPFALKK